MVRSIMSQEQTWVANDFLVVEAALYPKGTYDIPGFLRQHPTVCEVSR
jgi:hypothetical protein